ncbi:hypothetical protein [uncultured Sphingomonas sp.]|uniref:hypothetical protein n=1 Tax=uncultured Sphingomonas sp. TaxID=158754 RepID=UPI0035CC7457
MPLPADRKLAWVLKQNRRYAPLLDTGLKLSPILVGVAAAMGIWLWTIFSGYFGQLGQAPLPVTQAGDWLFLLLFGFIISVVFAAIIIVPAAWTSTVRSIAPQTMEAATIIRACGACATATFFMTALAFFLYETRILLWVIATMIVGGLAGGLVMACREPSHRLFGKAFLGFAASSLALIVWLSVLFALLAPTVASSTAKSSLAVSFGLLAALAFLIACSIMKPVAGLLVGLAITVIWLFAQASPDGGRLIASALYTANLGGGRPARVAQDHVVGEICNLAVEARPVWVYEPNGCERGAAFRRLDELKGLGSLARKLKLAVWRSEASCHLRRRPANAKQDSLRLCRDAAASTAKPSGSKVGGAPASTTDRYKQQP